jgi:hypothetical protein
MLSGVISTSDTYRQEGGCPVRVVEALVNTAFQQGECDVFHSRSVQD